MCPAEFKDEARKLLRQVAGCNPGTTDEELRKALFKFIADFANWDTASNRTYLDVSRALVKAAHGEEPTAGRRPICGRRLDPAGSFAARLRGVRERSQPRRLLDI